MRTTQSLLALHSAHTAPSGDPLQQLDSLIQTCVSEWRRRDTQVKGLLEAQSNSKDEVNRRVQLEERTQAQQLASKEEEITALVGGATATPVLVYKYFLKWVDRGWKRCG